MVLKDKKTKITFHSGILTIGGTIIEVEYEDSHIFFDFGAEFKPELDLKDESLGTLIEHRLVPDLNGIYDPRLNYSFPFEQKNKFENTAVFLSHVHLDHTKVVNYLNPKIPVYALKETKVLLESLNSDNDFILPLHDTSEGFTRKIIPCNNEEHVKIGDIDVQLLRVDHDAYGACGLLINTPDLSIAYTGDLRLHGFDEKDTLKFIEKAKNSDVTIIEGVSISFVGEDEDEKEEAKEIKSEQELVDSIVELVENNPDKQITFNCYPANVKRVQQIVLQTPRKVVLEASLAYILKECLDMDVHYYKISDNDYGLNADLEVRYTSLLNDESKYLWQAVDNFDKLKGGGIYIHSNAAPLGEFDPAYLPFVNMFEENDIEFHRLACSGHAHVEDLDKIVDLLETNLLIPIHSLKPELLKNPHGDRYLPKRGKTI